MRAGNVMRRLGTLGLWLGSAYLVLVQLLFLDAERFGGRYLNWLARPLTRVVVGGDPSDPNVQESFGFLMVFGSIVVGILVVVSLLVFIVGKVLERRAERLASANAG
jgi:hypothetical protein